MNTIKTHAQNQLNIANKNLDLIKSTMQYFAQQQLKLASTQIESLMRESLLQNPQNVLAKGYAIVRHEGKAIHSIHQVSSSISIEMQDGQIHANVSEVISNE